MKSYFKATSILSDILDNEGADVQGKVLVAIHLMQKGAAKY